MSDLRSVSREPGVVRIMTDLVPLQPRASESLSDSSSFACRCSAAAGVLIVATSASVARSEADLMSTRFLASLRPARELTLKSIFINDLALPDENSMASQSCYSRTHERGQDVNIRI